MIFKRIIGFLAAAVLAVSIGTAAYADSLAVGGEAVGISVSTQGVIVEGFSAVETDGGAVSPAKAAGVKKGDIIIALDGKDIGGADDLGKAISGLDGGSVKMTVIRGEKEKTLKITPAKAADGAFRLGLWLRDGVSGVGTVTFFDPETGLYGALGHGITDGETGTLLPLSDGSIFDAEIVDVKKGQKGAPGELCGERNEAKVLGDIRINCDCGIFGTGEFSGGEIMETGAAECGKAVIRCTLDERGIGEYEIEIVRVFERNGCTCFQLKVTDAVLLGLTGGIVQGMSGSPIIQNGCLVGAVTHVFVNDPTSGYGLSIESMLEAAA